jgi:hypothetical protein
MATDIYGKAIINSIADLNVRWHFGGPPDRTLSIAIEETDSGKTILSLDRFTARTLAERILAEVPACDEAARSL